MLWAVIIAVGFGLLIGLRWRVYTVLVASGAIVAACAIYLPLADWSFIAAALFGYGLATALQLGYLVGTLFRLYSTWGTPRSAKGVAPDSVQAATCTSRTVNR